VSFERGLENSSFFYKNKWNAATITTVLTQRTQKERNLVCSLFKLLSLSEHSHHAYCFLTFDWLVSLLWSKDRQWRLSRQNTWRQEVLFPTQAAYISRSYSDYAGGYNFEGNEGLKLMSLFRCSLCRRIYCQVADFTYLAWPVPSSIVPNFTECSVISLRELINKRQPSKP
jgi:hypothetical protein